MATVIVSVGNACDRHVWIASIPEDGRTCFLSMCRNVARHGLGEGVQSPKLKVSHTKQSSPFLCYQKVYRMNYMADVSKHIHV